MSVKQKSKSTPRRSKSFVSDAFSPAQWDELPKSIRSEVEMYGKVLRSQPMADYMDFTRNALSDYVESRVTAYVSLGMECLTLEPVIYLVNKTFSNKQVELHVTTSFNESVKESVAAGIAHMLTTLFLYLELGVKRLSNAALYNYGLDECQAETFRVLASEYVGTFDELLETTKTL